MKVKELSEMIVFSLTEGYDEESIEVVEEFLDQLINSVKEECAKIVDKIAKRDYHDNWFNQETIDDIIKTIRDKE